MTEDIKKILESLSPNERKILPHLEEKEISEICKKSNLDKVSVIRSLNYLQSKGIIEVSSIKSIDSSKESITIKSFKNRIRSKTFEFFSTTTSSSL